MSLRDSVFRSVVAIVVVAAVGCSNEVVYHPRVSAPASGVDKTARADTLISDNAATKKEPPIVEKVGDVNLAAYGIPIYPGATLSEGSNLAYKSADKKNRQIEVTLESRDAVPLIADWYKNQIKASQAYLLTGELGSIDGTTSTGYHVTITVAKLERKSTILISVEENS